MLTASEVGDHLIALSKQRGEPFSSSKLQCLLYYSQAWHLAIYDECLFNDDIEARTNGPAVPSVRRHFEKQAISIKPGLILEPAVQVHLQKIVCRYGSRSACELEHLIQTEPPWIIARQRYPIDERMIVQEDVMRLYYRYGSQDLVTRSAIALCRAWTAIIAFGFDAASQ
jgi:uncharacterized phage-associated protein